MVSSTSPGAIQISRIDYPQLSVQHMMQGCSLDMWGIALSRHLATERLPVVEVGGSVDLVMKEKAAIVFFVF